jgi:toxin FitB
LFPASGARLEQWLDQDLPEWFEDRILGVDQRVADRWGLLRARAQAIGRSLSVIDALLAATALEHDLTMVSRNVSDFQVVGLAVVNPWGD